MYIKCRLNPEVFYKQILDLLSWDLALLTALFTGPLSAHSVLVFYPGVNFPWCMKVWPKDALSALGRLEKPKPSINDYLQITYTKQTVPKQRRRTGIVFVCVPSLRSYVLSSWWENKHGRFLPLLSEWWIFYNKKKMLMLHQRRRNVVSRGKAWKFSASCLQKKKSISCLIQHVAWKALMKTTWTEWCGVLMEQEAIVC